MVVAQTPPPTTTVRTRTAYREPTPPAAPDDKAPVWAFLWTLFFFKIATVAIIMYKHPGHVTNILVLVTTWFWVIVPMIALSAPVAFRWRLMRLRKRRAAMRQSEWLVE